MVDKEIIKKKLQSQEPDNFNNEEISERLAEIMIEKCIPELEQNLMEWAEDKPFADIVVGDGWTVNKILEIFPWVSFDEILYAMKFYKENGYEDEMFTMFFYRC